MGLALFAFRKSSLTWAINNLEYKLTCISQRLQTLSEISSMQYESYASSMRSMLDSSDNLTVNENQVSLFEAQAAQISAIEKPLELQKERIETQLTTKQNELQSIEKAEENAAKRQAPKFA